MIDQNFIEHKWREYLSSIPVGEQERDLQFSTISELKSLVTTGYQLNREKILPVKFSFTTDMEALKATLKIQTR